MMTTRERGRRRVSRVTGWLTGLSLLAAVGVSAGIGVAQDNSAGSGTTAAPVDAGTTGAGTGSSTGTGTGSSGTTSGTGTHGTTGSGTTGSGTGSSTRSGSGSGVQLGTGSGRVHTESRGS